MIRNINITVDRTSWRGGIPSEIHSLKGPRATNIRDGLLHTALRTRPPVVHGFNLSDLWAWMRYGYAIDTTAALRLRPEWSDTDAHQKAVMSDELGVGLTTQLLVEELGFWLMVDTLYLVRVLAPSYLALASKAKRGPAKSPDFIAFDSKLRPSVVECKGTQTSHAALLQAMKSGRAQKANVRTQGARRIRHSLVIGLFLPQANNLEAARIHIADPDWNETGSFLARHSPQQLARAAVQIELAKHLALMGQFRIANFLASTPTDELGPIPGQLREELSHRRTQGVDRLTFSREYRPVADETLTGAVGPTSIDIAAPTGLIERLLGHDLRAMLDEMVADSRERNWPSREHELHLPLVSTLGFEFSLH